MRESKQPGELASVGAQGCCPEDVVFRLEL